MSDIKNLPRTDGRVEVPFGLGSMARSSVAWNPDSGVGHRANTPRIVDGKIPVFKFKPRVFDTFPEPTLYMGYDVGSSPTAKYWIGQRQDTFETLFLALPGASKLNLGTSFGGRTIDGYRLGPITGKHFVLVHGVHGNEVDGLDGGIRAVEILATDPAFQNFRDEWTLLFIPALNPDGWFNDLRNLQEVGPNGKTINLNRQFDWFWDEYVESSLESKGSAPFSTAEASALEDYRIAVEGAGGSFGAMMDFHANQGVGSRYQSRDRIYREILFGPGEGGTVPESWLTVPLDYYIWQIHKSFSTARTLADPGAIGGDLFVRYFRSRFRPHLHSYYSSLGVFSFVIEEVKVDNAGGRETYASANNFRIDYTLAAAAAITTDNWEFKDAVLVEEATQNTILSNPEWKDWQDDSRVSPPSTPEERPSFFSLSRADVERATSKEGEVHFQDGSEAVRLISDIDIELSTPAEFNAATNDGLDSIVVVTSYGNVFGIPSERFRADDLFPNSLGTPFVGHPTTFASAAIKAPPAVLPVTGPPLPPSPPFAGTVPTKAIDILGGGTAPFVGASSLITRVYTDEADGAIVEERPIETDPPTQGTGWTPRMHMGYADNFLAFPAPGGEKGYIVGGQDAAATALASLGVWDPVPESFTLSAHALPAGGTVGPLAVFNPLDGLVYIFGGLVIGVPSTFILTWDPTFDVLTDISGTVSLTKPLAHMAGAFHPGTGKIFIYGGEEASGDMNEEIYEFDPVGLTITALVLTANLDDDEDSHDDEDATGVWDNKFGRWSAATLVEDSTDPGVPTVIGGRNKDGGIPVDALSAAVYEHDIEDEIFSLAAESSFGYIRFSSPIRREFVHPSTGEELGKQVDETFDAALGADFSDPNTNWTVGGGVATTGSSGPLIMNTAPNFNNQRVEVDVRKDGAGAIGDFSIVLRADYSGATLNSGYRFRNDGAADWFIDRIVGGVPTNVFNTTIGAGQQITTSFRTAEFTLTGRDPVKIEASMNGTLLFSGYDPHNDRIVDIGLTAIEGASSTDNIEIDDLKMLTSGQNELRYTASISAKSNPDNVSGYVRATFFPKDDTETDQFVTRRVRNYYTLPPKNLYYWYHARVDLRDGDSSEIEDGMRYYERLYKNDQKVLLDGLHIQEGTLVTSSYQHPDFPRSKEIFTFPDAVNPNAFRVEFCWLTTTNFTDLDEDIEIARIEVDANNYIALVAKAGVGNSRWEREYNNNDVHGPHDPTFELQKRTGPAVTELCYNANGYNNFGYNIGPCTSLAVDVGPEVVSYWGYDMRDPSGERQDDVLKFTISHIAGSLWELKVARYGDEGRATSSVNLDSFTGDCASIIYKGVGYYSKPEIVDLAPLPNGRKVPARRRGLLDRIRGLARPQVLVGERDPTGGQIVRDFPFIEGDDFNRPDDPSLGNDWEDGSTVFYQTGSGFNILSNQASCTDEGFNRWDRKAQHSDVIITADVTIDQNNDIVGFLARWDTDLRDTTRPFNNVTGYGAELVQLTGSTAEVRVVRWFRGVKAVLATTALASYTAGASQELKFTLLGPSLTVEVTGDNSAVATDTNFKKPKRLGIYGQTGGPAQDVTIDNFSVTQNFESSVE